ITGTARALGLSVKPVRSIKLLQAAVKERMPACVIVDLAHPGLVLEDFIGNLKDSCNTMPRLVAYGSHVDAAGLKAARDAGCDVVLPRSKFVEELGEKLPEWLSA